jgi:hypothetical protein
MSSPWLIALMWFEWRDSGRSDRLARVFIRSLLFNRQKGEA